MLRTALVATLVSVADVWADEPAFDAETKASIAKLKELGAFIENAPRVPVGYDHELLMVSLSREVVAKPDAVSAVADAVARTNCGVRLTIFGAATITDGDIARLAKPKNIRALQLVGRGVTDGVVARFAKLPKVEALWLDSCDVETLNSLADSPLLTAITAYKCNKLKGDALKPLAAMKGLTSLSILDCDADMWDLSHLAGLTKLRLLHLRSIRFAAGSWGNLTALAGVRELDVSYSGIADDDLKVVAKWPKLETLGLRATKIADAGLKHLEKHPALQEVSVDETKVTAGVSGVFKSLPALEWVGISHTKVTRGDRPVANGIAEGRVQPREGSVKLTQRKGDTSHSLDFPVSGTGVSPVIRRCLVLLPFALAGCTKDAPTGPAVPAVVIDDKPKEADKPKLPALDNRAASDALKALGLVPTLDNDSVGRPFVFATVAGEPLADERVVAVADALAKIDADVALELKGVGKLTDKAVAAFEGSRAVKGLILPQGNFDGAAPTSVVKATFGLPQLEWLAFAGDLTDAEFAGIAALKNLRLLKFDGRRLTDDCLRHLAGLTELRRLYHPFVIEKPLTDAGLAHLAGLTHLQQLDLQGPMITDVGLAKIAGLTELDTLKLYQIDATTLEPLAGLTNLRKLTVFGCESLAGDALKPLAGATKLAELQFRCAKPKVDAKHLAGLTRLEKIDLRQSSADGTGFNALRNLRGVKSLELSGTPFADRGLVALEYFRGLELLDLSRTKVTDAGMVQINGHPKLKQLKLDDTAITDAGADQLGNLQDLQELTLTDTKVTKAKVEELRKQMPRAEIAGGE